MSNSSHVTLRRDRKRLMPVGIEQMLVHLTGGRVPVETVHSKLIRTPRRRELALWEARRNRVLSLF
jgi:hypothetical protein